MEKLKLWEEKIKEVDEKVRKVLSLEEWKFKQNVKNGESINLDDKKWEVRKAPLNWSLKEGIAYWRKWIEIPESIEKINVEGSKLELTFVFPSGVELFINGKKVYSHKFWADKVATPVLIKEKAKGGEKFLITFKTPQGDGLGYFWANLKIGKIEETIFQLNSILYQLKLAEFITKKEKKLKESFEKAVDLIKPENIEKKKWDDVRKNIEEVEKTLEVFRKYAKKYKVHLIGHAHIDMNWLWTYEDTVNTCLRDFRTVTTLMDKYKDLTFSQSQVHIYKIIEENDKGIFKKVKERVKEGRWESTANAYVEGDLNIPDGESIVRHIIYSKKYNREKFGKNPSVFWSPDTFGHPHSIPTILSDAEIKYYYFMRCGKGMPLFRWRGKNGREVLAFNSIYNNSIKPETIIPNLIDYLKKYNIDDFLFVYGVGDHGGGPTIDDIERKKKLDEKPCMPDFIFSTAENYFKKVEKNKKKLPVVNDELNFIFEGCYTTHCDIKRGNRNCERKLLSLESLIASSGKKVNKEEIEKLWEKTLFNQFHDVIDGSAIHSSYDFSNRIAEEVNKGVRKIEKAILESLKKKDKKKITIFNPLGWERDEYVDVDLPEGYAVEDREGNISVVSEGKILCKKLKGYGFKTYNIKKRKIAENKIKKDGFKFENEFYSMEIDPETGLIRKLYDIVNKKDVIPECKSIHEDPSSWWAERSGNLIKVLWEKPHPLSAWIIGNIYRVDNLIDAKKIKVEEGKKIVKIVIEREYGNCPVYQRIFIYRDFPYIDFEFETDWKIQGSTKTGVPMLRVNFNFNIENGKFYCEIPFSVMKRKNIPREYPSLKWAGLFEKKWGVSILNRDKHGYYVDGNNLSLTLLRNSYEPDSSSDTGHHKVSYRLLFGKYSITDVMKKAFEFNFDVMKIDGEINKKGIFSIEGNVIPTSFKKSIDGKGYILRFVEVEGKKGKAKIKFTKKVKGLFKSNIVENQEKRIKVKEGEAILSFSPYSVNTYKIIF